MIERSFNRLLGPIGAKIASDVGTQTTSVSCGRSR